jgi:hypothetical protein
MEVHQHTHNPRKKWTHYFWEFLMLFLAVFCGFLAENQREHYVEKQRAKQFAASLIKDLKRDTAALIICKLHANTITDAMNSLSEMLRRPDMAAVRGNYLYYCARQLTNNHPFVASDATIKQLMGSGGLRYFRSSSIVDKIAEYDRILRWLVYDQGDNVKAHYLWEQQAEFFDINQIELITIKFKSDWSFENDSALHIQAGLLTLDPLRLQQLKQMVRLKRLDLIRFVLRIDTALALATELIEGLKKEFHLK